jgi:peptidoglycan glycosyltransferase
VGFAPAEDPQVAVAVIIENAGQGGVDAAPLGGAVMRAVLGK